MKVNIIVACDNKGGIGNNNSLPWPKNSIDMAWFRKNTEYSSILMGKETWKSLGGKKLPRRRNMVMTRSVLCGPDNIYSGHISWVLKHRERLGDEELWIIGGANLIAQSLEFVDNVYLTIFNSEYECDTFIDLDYIESTFSEVRYCDNSNEDMTFYIRGRDDAPVP